MLGRVSSAMVLLVLVVVLLFSLSACTYSYLPPIPASNLPTRTPRLTLSSASTLSFENERLELQVVAVEIPQEGWLELQFFDPFGTEIGSASEYLSSDSLGKVRYIYPPVPIKEDGNYRVIASFKGTIIRQFSVDVFRD